MIHSNPREKKWFWRASRIIEGLYYIKCIDNLKDFGSNFFYYVECFSKSNLQIRCDSTLVEW